jgi:hypothetical protein
MTNYLTDAYWEQEFNVTPEDLNRLYVWVKEENCARTLTEFARRVVGGRLRFGPVPETSARTSEVEWESGKKFRLWDPAGNWHVGDRVIVLRNKGKQNLVPFAGQIVKIKEPYVDVSIEDEGKTVTYNLAGEKSTITINVRKNIREAIQRRKEQIQEGGNTTELEENINLILMVFGERVFSLIQSSIQKDKRFLLEQDKWFVTDALVSIPTNDLDRLYWHLLENKTPHKLASLLTDLSLSFATYDVGLFSLYQALNQTPEKFCLTDAGWIAIKPPPPPWHQAVSAFYVYDPATYAIILQPAQPLTLNLAERLEAFGGYADLVVPA